MAPRRLGDQPAARTYRVVEPSTDAREPLPSVEEKREQQPSPSLFPQRLVRKKLDSEMLEPRLLHSRDLLSSYEHSTNGTQRQNFHAVYCRASEKDRSRTCEGEAGLDPWWLDHQNEQQRTEQEAEVEISSEQKMQDAGCSNKSNHGFAKSQSKESANNSCEEF